MERIEIDKCIKQDKWRKDNCATSIVILHLNNKQLELGENIPFTIVTNS